MPAYAVLSLTAGDAEQPGLLGYIKGLRFIRIEAFDTDAAVTATELLRFGHSWAAVHAIHAARPCVQVTYAPDDA
ncbi:hypothetical protein ABT275_36950 [Streptomyces sp. NPDC001185]|uniref:hypothetical protein n=1 Tax=Streptomyces sp. NPDC001185 TaxID=3154380 RepID=UPI00331CB880